MQEKIRQNPKPFMIKKKKTFQKVSIEETYLNMIKAIYHKLTAYIIPNGEKLKLKSFSSIIRNKTRMPPLTTFIQHILEVAAQQSSFKCQI